MRSIYLLGCALAIALSPITANAGVITFADRATFEATGTIAENYGFEDFSTNDFSFPPDPWTTHGVTYTTGDNLVVGSNTFYHPISNVFAYNGWSPVPGTIGGAYDMFGFDLAMIGTLSPVTIQIITNVATYDYSGLLVPNASVGQDFYGFSATGGEYFTGFNVSSLIGSGSAPVLDNVTLGTTGEGIAAIPEPTSMLLLGSGLAGFIAKRRRRRV
jgi:hypothetical protein